MGMYDGMGDPPRDPPCWLLVREANRRAAARGMGVAREMQEAATASKLNSRF